MPIFSIDKEQLVSIKEEPFKLEKDLQKIAEDNLETIFGLDFVVSEFSLNNLRIDTLAFDKETNAFVIIEYKRGKSFSVIDQGYAYLALMLNNKADFILEYNERTKHNLKRDDVDWSQSRVLFVANSFTNYQQSAINFNDLPIELWEVKKYNNKTILFNLLKATNTTESIKTVSKSKEIESVSREVKKYSLDDHFKEGWDEMKELYESLSEKVFALDGRIEAVPTKNYIGFKIDKNVLIAITIRKSKLRIELYRVQPENLNDPNKVLSYIKTSMKFYNKHVSEFFVNTPDEVDYALFLVKQVYERLYK
jgi:predicted transport protein